MGYKVKLLTKIKVFDNYLRYFFRTCWLPITLIFIFVLQNHFFNAWLDLPVRPYFIRRSFVTSAFGLLLFGPALFFRKSTRYLYLISTSLFVALIFILQFLYYSYSGGFLQSSALFYAGEGVTILATVKTLLTYHLIFFVAGLLTVITVWVLVNRNIITEIILNKKEQMTAGIIILVLTISGYGYIFFRENMEAGNTAHIYQYNKLFDVNALESKIGIVNFSLGDMLTLGLQTDKVTAADINFVTKYKEQQPTTTPGFGFGMLKGRNLILIQVESLENAVIGQKINGQEITPHLNKLADEGLYFSNYYSPIGPGTTADAEFMTLNSLYSLPDTVAFIQYAKNHYTALPSLLRDSGYHTYSFHGDVFSFWNRANIYPQLGYEKSFSQEDYTIPRKIGVYHLGDKDFFEQSIPKLKSLPQPFMATLITLTSHTPFEMPIDLQALNIPATNTLNKLQQNYLQSVRYTDQAIGDFVEQLKSAGLYDNSLILIYGDHGSFTKINSALKIKNSIFADLQTSQVPMIILAPSTSLQGDRNTPASHLDLYPTVANLLGLKLPTDIFGREIIYGKNALVISRNLVSGTIKSIITNNFAYHISSDGVFEHGTCLEMPGKKKLTTNHCQALYDEATNAVKASDLMVKGNLIGAH